MKTPGEFILHQWSFARSKIDNFGITCISLVIISFAEKISVIHSVLIKRYNYGQYSTLKQIENGAFDKFTSNLWKLPVNKTSQVDSFKLEVSFVLFNQQDYE